MENTTAKTVVELLILAMLIYVATYNPMLSGAISLAMLAHKSL